MLKRFSSRFEPYPSIWKSLRNLKFGSKNAFFKLKLKIFDLRVKSRNFCLIVIFWKVQVLGYIFHIYHLCSKWILMELRAFEATCKIIVFYQNHFWKYYVRVHGKDSKMIPKKCHRHIRIPYSLLGYQKVTFSRIFWGGLSIHAGGLTIHAHQLTLGLQPILYKTTSKHAFLDFFEVYRK